jgi:hypothetical protein
MNEHYCRRWISIKTIEQSIEQNNSHFFDAQFRDMKTAETNFVSHPQLKILSKDCMRSISVESWLPEREEKIKFIDNKSIRKQIVGVTCETCAVKNCKERASAPIQLEQKNSEWKYRAYCSETHVNKMKLRARWRFEQNILMCCRIEVKRLQGWSNLNKR